MVKFYGGYEEIAKMLGKGTHLFAISYLVSLLNRYHCFIGKRFCSASMLSIRSNPAGSAAS